MITAVGATVVVFVDVVGGVLNRLLYILYIQQFTVYRTPAFRSPLLDG